MFRSATNRRTVVFEREIGKKTKIGAQFPQHRENRSPCSGERASSLGRGRTEHYKCDTCIQHYCKQYPVLSRRGF